MHEKSIDVTGIGNAIVDVLSRADDAFLADHGIEKGAMNLVDGDRSDWIYSKMGPGVEISGGSAANTIVGVTGLGGTGAFIGKVKDDTLGRVFRHDITAEGPSLCCIVASKRLTASTDPDTASSSSSASSIPTSKYRWYASILIYTQAAATRAVTMNIMMVRVIVSPVQ